MRRPWLLILSGAVAAIGGDQVATGDVLVGLVLMAAAFIAAWVS